METKFEGPPKSVVKAISSLSGGQMAAKAAGALLKWSNSKGDHTLTKVGLDFMGKATNALKRALPDTDPELIGGFLANLFDLWETGKTLDSELQKLIKLHLPQDRERLHDILIWIDAIQIDMASYWISEVKKELPKLLKALDSLEGKSRRSKQKRARAGRDL